MPVAQIGFSIDAKSPYHLLMADYSPEVAQCPVGFPHANLGWREQAEMFILPEWMGAIS
jgi:hypothetical protein